jgi:hypothetical protein
MEQEEVRQQKDIEFYSASIQGWLNTKIEHDKSILTLSAGGIGLLITLLTTIGIKSAEYLVLYVSAIICFVITIGVVLAIFKRNSTYIEKVILNEGHHTDTTLNRLDIMALGSFGFGVFLTALIGVSVAINSYTSNAITMGKKDSTNRVIIGDSFNGFSKLKIISGQEPSPVSSEQKAVNQQQTQQAQKGSASAPDQTNASKQDQ